MPHTASSYSDQLNLSSLPQKLTNTETNYTNILDPSAEEREEEYRARRQRKKERNERVKEIFKNVKPRDVERVSE